jgi:transposase
MPSTPPYSLEFRHEAVRRLRTSGRSVPQLSREAAVAQELGARARRRRGQGAEGLTSDEREQLRRLRRESKILAEDRKILRKVAAFFARYSETRR